MVGGRLGRGTVRDMSSWLDYALDRAHDAGWLLKWEVRDVPTKTNVGPKVRRLHCVAIPGITPEHTGSTLDSAAAAFAQSTWPPPDWPAAAT
jgi:hypothetical protein